MGGGGESAEPNHSKKAWPSINCSILSDCDLPYLLCVEVTVTLSKAQALAELEHSETNKQKLFLNSFF
jgi:hypothetical protein